MKAFLEVTEWNDCTPNHVYFMSDNKSRAFGYVAAGTKKPHRFKTPMTIDIRGRKFKEIPNTWRFQVEEEKPAGKSWQIQGSRGDTYTVSQENNQLSCTCSGFKFRGNCRHIAEVQLKIK